MSIEVARFYLCAWGALVVAGAVVMIRSRESYDILSTAYLRSLLVPWKLATFVVAAALIVVAAPYTGDPTWDHVDATFMSVLTYVTAPWAVGVFVRVKKGLLPKRQLFVALVVGLFVWSWSYDGYLFLRDGRYPPTWLWNMVASGTLYVSAGMMWSLTHVVGRGIVFDFMTADWYRTPPARFRKIVLFAVLVAAGVTLSMLPFAIEAVSTLRGR